MKVELLFKDNKTETYDNAYWSMIDDTLVIIDHGNVVYVDFENLQELYMFPSVPVKCD